MKARYTGTCNLCHEGWHRGAEIGRWLGSYVHQDCKDQEFALIRSQGSVETLPEHRGLADVAPVVGFKAHRQSGLARNRQLT